MIPIGYPVGLALLLMSNNWAESGLESGQKPISLSSNLPVGLTMQHAVAGVADAGEYSSADVASGLHPGISLAGITNAIWSRCLFQE